MKTKHVLTGVIIITSALASFSQVSFTEKNNSGGTGQSFDKERKVWISGSKGRIMSRSTEGASQENANAQLAASKSASTQAQNEGAGRIDNTLTDMIAKAEADLEQLKKAKKQDKTAIEQKQRQIDEMKAKRGDVKEMHASSAEKVDKQYQQIDTKAVAKESQDATATADIIRLDQGMIWTVNPKQMTYQEKKMINNSPKTPAAAMPFVVEVQDLGKVESIAGHDCKRYLVTAYTVSGSTKSVMLKADIWVAEDLEDAKKQLLKFNSDYQEKNGISPDAVSQGVNACIMLANAIGDFGIKINALKGMVLKKVINMQGGGTGLSYTTEIAKVSISPIDDKMFELPEGVKKVK
jgi:hypothetical protein